MKLISIVFVLLLSGLLAVSGFAYYFLHAPLQKTPHDFVYIYPAKTSIRTLFYSLENAGMLKHYQADCLYLYLRLTKQDKSLKAGEYALNTQMTPLQLLAKLQKGDVIKHQLVLIEGQTFAQALAKIQAHPKIKRELQAKSQREIAKILQLPFTSLEGLIFPDTYYFTLNTTDTEILNKAYQHMQAKLKKIWDERDTAVVLQSPYEALILASIIEKESALASERYLISGVFQRRMQNNMRLEADPTVVYGVKKQIEYQCQYAADDFKGGFRLGWGYASPVLHSAICSQLNERVVNQSRLTREDLKENTPYNTYTVKGLPPTPIALPSLSAVHAACHPDKSQYLYFVAKGDGSHYFSTTLEEHHRAVNRYIKGITNEG